MNAPPRSLRSLPPEGAPAALGAARHAAGTPATVTVAIPVYNGAGYIEAAVRSAMGQSYGEIEILVVDNASTDDTVAIVERTARDDRRVRLVRNPANVGMIGNFNRCLELAATDCIKLVCADDLLEPDCVARMVRVLEANPGVALVGCARRLVGPAGEPRAVAAFGPADVVVSGGEAMNRCFFEGNLIGEPTAVMFRKAQASRGFSADYNQAVDLEMWFHLLEQGDLAFLAQPLCAIRLHDDQQTVRNARSGRIVEDKRRLFRACAGRPWLRPSLLRKLHWDLRMASSVAKAGAAAERAGATLEEVYFGRLFRHATLPAARFASRLRAP